MWGCAGTRRLPLAEELVRKDPDLEEDVLVLEARPEVIDPLVGALGLEYVRRAAGDDATANEDLAPMEVVVPEGARIQGRSARSLRLLWWFEIPLGGGS